jgi:hypothetical protein
MKLLVLTATSDDPSYIAIRYFLDYIGVPYQTVVATTQSLPALDNGSKGFYQGIILASGNLAVCDPTCRIPLPDAGWTALDTYTRDYGVRTVSYYTWPEDRYGLQYVSSLSTDPTVAHLNFTAAAANVFPYLRRTGPLPIRYAWTYLANPVAATGETTTPILTVNGLTTGVIHQKADGREYMALTFDNSPFLLHSLALNYGIINWVTNGMFIGARKIYMTPQIDDTFLPNDLYVATIPECVPTGFQTDPTVDPAINCPNARITKDDLATLSSWQASVRAISQFQRFKVTHAFNGFGTTADGGAPDPTLANEAKARANDYYWVNHTWDHEHLDCFNPVPGSGVCTPATSTQASQEITQNIALAQQLGLPLDSASMVTPAISGLNNAAFLSAAKASGIKYLISDASRPEYVPANPNTGLRSTIEPSILFIPRRATNIFYNTISGFTNAEGSLPDEYNYFFGPSGIFKLPDGSPFFSTTQSYEELIGTESDNLLAYMMRYEIYPQMYHQSNLWRYTGNRSLFIDVIEAAFIKFQAISSLPVLSLDQSSIGRELEERMAVNKAQVQATLTPGSSITLTAPGGTANVSITGVCATGCEAYGGQSISKIPVSPAAPTVVTFGAPPPPSIYGPVNTSIATNFNDRTIILKRRIWFNSVLTPGNLGGQETTFQVRNGKITFTVRGQAFTLQVPDADVKFTSSVTRATTTFNTSTNRWETIVPLAYTGNVFLTGLTYVVPTGGIPGSIGPVTWSGDVFSTRGGTAPQWKWAAAVYSSFASTHSALRIKPLDGNKLNPYNNLDKAGTPENYRWAVIPGALGLGGTNYTGTHTAAANLQF